MKKFFKKSVLAFMLVLLITCMFGCGNKENQPQYESPMSSSEITSENSEGESDSSFKPVTDGGNYQVENDY